jgi:hypothetical protein
MEVSGFPSGWTLAMLGGNGRRTKADSKVDRPSYKPCAFGMTPEEIDKRSNKREV